MDKWRHKGKAVAISEDSLLPPTLRILNQNSPQLLDTPRSKKWSIDGFFKKISSILEDQSSSSSLEELSEKHRKKVKSKSKGITRPSGYAYNSPEGFEYSAPGIYRTSNDDYDYDAGREDLVNANSMSQTLELLDARLIGGNHSHSRSSDGSLDGPGRRVRKDKVKARVEAKRDQLCVGDSSMDESSNEDVTGSRNGQKEPSKRRSRASRTERYLKRMCNGGNGNGKHNGERLMHVADSRNLEGRGVKPDEFRPIEGVPRSKYVGGPMGINNGNQSKNCYDNDIPTKNLYSRQAEIGVNPLVQQTLQYFSEFDRNMAASQSKARKTYPGHNSPHHRRSQSKPSPGDFLTATVQPAQSFSNVTPPKPPSRDHRSRILVNGTSLDKYQHMLKYVPRPPVDPQSLSQGHYADKENGYGSARSSLHSPSCAEVRDINEGNAGYMISPNSTMHKYIPLSPPRSPLRESLNMVVRDEDVNSLERNQSSLLSVNKSKFIDKASSSGYSPILQSNDYENSNYMPYKKTEVDKPNERRSSKNLEEALYELEAIYNSLQLGDEELLDRAEKRTLEEFHYKGFTVSPDAFDNEDPALRRKTWGDETLRVYKEEPEVPDRLKDDMAYRRMHPKERPSSVDGQSSLSRISYLMTSPVPSRREMRYIDPKRKPRRKEPDVMLDDVVFRSIQYANNTLKVVEPQPPFGIPLGPITTATDSDYLHANPASSERSRSPYIPSHEPDIVTDDLAYRNLRKDACHSSCSNRQTPSPCLIPASPSPLSFGVKKKRAVRSLSANLYGLINKPSSPRDDSDRLSVNTSSTFDFFDEVPIKDINRRTSDPEMSINWQNSTWNNLEVNRNQSSEQRRQKAVIQLTQKENLSDADLSNGSGDESSSERIRPIDRLASSDMNEQKVGSDKSSSYVSSNCSTPPPVPPRRSVEPFTEQEISVYKKLCQDLENLVQLTKDIDSIPPRPIEFVAPPLLLPPKKIVVGIEETATPKSVKVTPNSPVTEVVSPIKPSVVEVVDSSDSEQENKADETIEESPINLEISSILDSLKVFSEESKCSESSLVNMKEAKEKRKDENVMADDKSFKEITKEICNLSARDDEDEVDKSNVVNTDKAKLVKLREREQLKEEEEERKDQVDDNVFFRNVQLAKLSGDWKESTPNGAATSTTRRTSLTAGDNNTQHWEGMNKCNHKYNSMPAKTSSLLPIRLYGSKRKSSGRKSMCSIS